MLAAVVSAAAFFLLSQIGMKFPLFGGEVAAFWPASGCALSLSILLGPPAVVGVFFGALASNLYSALSFWAACGIAAGNAAAAYAATALLRSLGFDTRLPRVGEVVKLVGAGAVPSGVVSAVFGIATLAIAGRIASDQVAPAAWAWWSTDALGALLVVPAMLGWSVHAGEERPWREWLQIGAALLGVVVLAVAIYTLDRNHVVEGYLTAFLLLPVLFWIAGRFPPCVAASAVILLVMAAILGTSRGASGLAAGVIAGRVFEVLAAVSIVVVATLAMSAAATERRHMVRRISEERERFAQLARLSSDWFWEQDEELRFTERMAELPAGYGLTKAAIVGKRRWEIGYEGVSEEVWAEHRRNLQARRPFREFVVSLRGTDGELRHLSISGEPYFDAGGAFRGYRGAALDITERKRAEARIEQLATRDPLTGLANRLLLADRTEHAIAAAQRFGRQLALIFIDLDRFKNVNDTFGHPIGDAFLRAVAERIASQLRASDSLARMGGDEFVVLLSEIESNGDAAAVAAKIARALAEPLVLGGHTLRAAASMGIALYPGDGAAALELLGAADIAMYQAKADGGTAFRFFSPDMNTRARDRLLIESELHSAVERDELVLHYQPVLLSGGAVSHAEALVRWRHPRLGLLAPGQFIGIAEESGVIREIGERIIALAAEQRAAWRGLAPDHFYISVNLAADQLSQGDVFVDGFVQAANRAGIGFHQLSVEITESRLMQNLVRSSAVVEQLKNLGVRVALDDFGTGYSSLGYLKRFRVDTIKIDRSFVREIESDAYDRAIVAAVVALAGSLDVNVTAEGVETESQARLLAELGCRQLQGFYFSQPVEASAFEERFLRRR
jgi:diguanylate cyclase (GGDEF)-like protein/PAS domain S-box-containing protein